MLRDSAAELEQASLPKGSVRLLPYFDPYTLSLSHRTQHVLAEVYKPLVYRNQGWIYPVVLVDGRMAGVWGLEKKKNQMELKVDWFDSSPVKAGVRTNLEDEAGRLASFYDTDILLRC